MPVVLPLPNGRTQFVDGNGDPLVGGQVFSFVPGTDDPKSTWQDPDQSALNDNPLTLDDLGSAAIWAVGSVRQVVYDVDGNLIWDEVTSNALGQVADIDLSNVDPATGRASLVVDYIVDERQYGAAPAGGGGGANQRPIFDLAMAATPLGRPVYFRADQYRFDDGLTLNGHQGAIIGDGAGIASGEVSNLYCSQILANFGNGDILHFSGTPEGSRFEHFQVNSNVGQRTSGAGLHLDGTGLASTTLAGWRVHDLAFNNQFVGVKMTNTGHGVMDATYHQAWARAATEQTGDGVNEGSGGGFVTRNFYGGDTNPGTSQVACCIVRAGYTRHQNNLYLGSQIAVLANFDQYPAGALEILNAWCEDHDIAGVYLSNGNAKTASMIAVNGMEFSNSNHPAANRTVFQGHVVFAAGAAPWLTTSQIKDGRFRSALAPPGFAGFIVAATGSRVQIAGNNLEGLTGNTTTGIFVGAQAEQVDCFDNMVFGNFSAKYTLTAEVMFRDFSSRLTVAQLPTCHNGSLAWVEDGTPHSNPLIGGGSGCVAERKGGIWRALDSLDAPLVVGTDADYTFASGVVSIRHTGVLTANRLVTFPSGPREFTITRTGGGAFNLSAGGLKNLATNTYCVVSRDSDNNLFLAEYGAL